MPRGREFQICLEYENSRIVILSEKGIGVTAIKQKVSKATGIPLTKQGLERKIGGAILKSLTGKKKR